jgi:hypothetical protein
MMARPLSIEYPGAIYHVTFRGNERKPILRSDAWGILIVTLQPWIDYAPLLALLTPQKASPAVAIVRADGALGRTPSELPAVGGSGVGVAAVWRA